MPARRPYTPRMPAALRREQLLDAALRIVVRDGYNAVSIEAIAREVDVTRPVVYGVFDGLEELLAALLDRQERRALDQLFVTVSVEPDASDYVGYLETTIRDLVAMIAEDPLVWQPILLSSAGTPSAVGRRIERDREVFRTYLRQAIDYAAARGALRPGVDPEIASHMLLALAEHFGRLILSDPSAVDAERLATTVSTLFAS